MKTKSLFQTPLAHKIEFFSIEERQKQLAELKRKISQHFDGDKEDLENEIKVFKRQIGMKKNELISFQKKFDGENAKEKSILLKINSINAELDALIGNRRTEQALYAKKAKLTRQLCDKLSISITFDIDNCDERVNEYAGDIKRKMMEKENEYEEQKSLMKQEISKIEDKIEKLKKEQNQKDTQYAENNKRIEELKQKHSELKGLIQKNKEDADQLKNINDEIDRLQKEYDNSENVDRISSLQASIEGKKGELTEIADRLDDLENESMILSINADLLAKVNVKKQDLKKNEEQTTRYLNKHEKNLNKLFGDRKIEKDYKRNLDTLIIELNKESKMMDEKYRKSEWMENDLKTNMRRKRDDLTKRNGEIQRLRDQIYELCTNESYEDVLERTRDEATKYNMSLSMLRSSEILNKTYVEELFEKPACPLCHTGLEHDDVETLKDDLVKRNESLPTEIIEAEVKYNEANKKLEKLISLEKDVLRHKTLSDEVKNIEKEIIELEINSSKESKNTKELKEKLNKIQNNLTLATSMVSDIALLEKAKQTIAGLESEIKSLSGGLSMDANRTLEDLQAERKKLGDKKRLLDKEVDKLEKEIKFIELNNKRLSDELSKFKSRKIEIQDNIQSLTSHVNRLKEIEKTIVEYRDKNKEINSSLAPIVDQLNQLKGEKQNAERSNEIALEKMFKEKTVLNTMIREDRELQSEIESYTKMNLQSQISTKENILKDLISEQDETAEEKNKLAEKIAEIEKMVKEQDSIELNLHNNLDAFKFQEEIDNLKSKLKVLNETKVLINENHYKELIDRYNQISSDLHKSEGSRKEIENHIKDLKKKLSNDPYVNAVEKYRKAVSDEKVHLEIIESLKISMNGMELKMIEYHTKKITRINETIRDLWRNIYRGNDIDYIEVETSADEANYQNSRKRSYNYRVIQCKNGIKSSLRGNCSAGQRVLACLIIRIALAETFCSNCGVLTLDEPTTNLDQENIHALVESLNELIEERSIDSGFQLVVITHDKHFIQAMGGFDIYYEVGRDEKGISKITEKSKSALTNRYAN